MRTLIVCVSCLKIDFFGAGVFIKPIEEVQKAVKLTRQGIKTHIKVEEGQCEKCKLIKKCISCKKILIGDTWREKETEEKTTKALCPKCRIDVADRQLFEIYKKEVIK